MVDVSFSLETFENFLLILVRISSFVSVAPFFSMTNTPAKVKIGFSAFVTILLYGILPKATIGYSDVIGYAIIVVREGITGLLIGFAASICNSIVLLSGNIIDLNMGLSMAMEYDPITRTNSPITGNFYNYLLLLLLVVTDMHHYILQALVDSFTLIPTGQQIFRWDALMTSMVKFMGDAMVIGFRIALPVFACIMILNCILGVMAKVAPQMNMFAVGMQLKVLLGMLVLLFTIQLLPAVSDFIFGEMKRMIVSMIEGMY
jgi:flagellar biosynthetic protein FliR